MGDYESLQLRRYYGEAYGACPPQAQSAVNNNFIMNPLNLGGFFDAYFQGGGAMQH